MEMRAKSAGKPANTNFRVFYFHSYPFTLISPGISIIMNHTGSENKRRKVTEIRTEKILTTLYPHPGNNPHNLPRCRLCPQPAPVPAPSFRRTMPGTHFMCSFFPDASITSSHLRLHKRRHPPNPVPDRQSKRTDLPHTHATRPVRYRRCSVPPAPEKHDGLST
jgi:hypothetical protein